MKTISCKILAFVSLVLLTAPAVCSDEPAVCSDEPAVCSDEPAVGSDEVATVKSVRKPVALPGLVVDFQNQCLDLEAKICLDAGYLELIACTKGSKEHESIVSVSSKALHIHTALLLLGADNGHPEMRKLVDEESQRWVNFSPSGDPVEVMLVVKNSDGKPIEKPICDFVGRSIGRLDEVGGDVRSDPSENAKQNAGKPAAFPTVFLFAGSRLRDAGSGPKQYLADVSGNVISIATFGDEVLCLPSHQTQQNNALMWQVKPDVLPKVGTTVTLRLRPKKNSPHSEDKKK